MRHKKLIITTLCLLTAVPSFARDFWTIYGEHLVYNYAIKAGTGTEPDVSNRLSSDEIMSVASKSFSESLGMRIGEVAWSRRGVALVCMFSKEPERCYLDVVMEATFNEVGFMNAPGFSQKFIQKARNFYAGSSYDSDYLAERPSRASRVPKWKNFNPRFGVSLSEMELVVSAPFYTFGGVYVEPRFGTERGFAAGFMKERWNLDLCDDGVALSYRLPRSLVKKKNHLTLTWRKDEDEIRLENTLIAR